MTDDAHRAGRVQSLFGPVLSGLRGAWGERAAAEFLRTKRGFRLVVRNWRNPRDRREELDLVAADGETLVFVEIKTRAPGARVPGYYAVDARKRQALRRAVRSYLRMLRIKPRTFRFDVVEVESGQAGPPEVRHFANVPLFSKYFRP
jgi:putative endonuclease